MTSAAGDDVERLRQTTPSSTATATATATATTTTAPPPTMTTTTTPSSASGLERELEPAADAEADFDVLWPTDVSADLAEHEETTLAFLSAVCDCLVKRHYCVVQTVSFERLREAAMSEVEFLKDASILLRAETAEAYLGREELPGSQDQDRCQALPVDASAEVPTGGLSSFDEVLSKLSQLLALTPEAFGARAVFSRTKALVRRSFGLSSEGIPDSTWPSIDDQDIQSGEVERFLTWVLRRKLCMLYLINGPACSLDLFHGNQEQLKDAIPDVKLRIRTGQIVLFRHDIMGYAFRPEGESLALQAWLLDALPPLEFRELPQPPGMYGLDRVHVTAAAERFPANCDGCDMSMAMFCAGTDALTLPPLSRFDKDLYWAPDRDAPMYGRAYIMHGSFCSSEVLLGFDNEFFGIEVEEAAAMAPNQRWICEVGYEVLHKGGWTKPKLQSQRIGVFLGDSGSEWNQMYTQQDRFVSTCNSGSVTCCRLSHLLGLTGPNLSVDTACSASLVATNAAAHLMRHSVPGGDGVNPLAAAQRPDNGLSLESAICMGILVLMHPAGWIGECAATMLSYRGRCFTFDSSADGFIRGEGCCAVYLRSVSDLSRSASDRSLAILMGSCANQDGRSASLTAPHGPSQQECIRASLREAQLKPADVTVGECHGTGTALGDPIEIGAVRSVMLGNRERPLLHCSAKAHVGHEEANAGVCGLIKVVLMLNGAVSLPNPHLRILNPHLDVNGYPVCFSSELTCTSYGSQSMGVSSFGFGGTNARADLWSDADKGPLKDGARIRLTKEESCAWIQRFLEPSSPGQFSNFLCAKPGH
ncbi:unnamed protein product [Polarella glacialis]|uniref:Ketosynthase family 3 (KS3) domain-containing protein n=1 Tax=Polarella glacialis TaxID=89957 RepID=A0A813FBI4_POLGL|nr:unnamed protein product [Polarella glacialis]